MTAALLMRRSTEPKSDSTATIIANGSGVRNVWRKLGIEGGPSLSFREFELPYTVRG
jgi:hypothetical protein